VKIVQVCTEESARYALETDLLQVQNIRRSSASFHEERKCASYSNSTLVGKYHGGIASPEGNMGPKKSGSNRDHRPQPLNIFEFF
jgi:hypothetical protein